MSEIKFSVEQLKAIETSNASLLVSAAAGSGKTAVLVERIIRMIENEENQISIDKLLVVTFTKAAAFGMKEKIYKALKSKEQTDYIKKQLLLLNISNISTVHSFCNNLIKKYAYKLEKNIPMNFTLSDETENNLLKDEALTEVLDSYYERDDEIFYKFVESYAPGRYDYMLNEIILKIYNYILSIPFYTRWLDDTINNLKSCVDLEKSIYFEILKDHILNLIDVFILKYETALDFIASSEDYENYNEQFSFELGELLKIDKSDNTINILNEINTISNSYTTLKRLPKGVNGAYLQGIRNSVKMGVKKIIEKFYEQDYNNIKNEINEVLPLFEKAFEIVKEFDFVFKEKKYSKNLLDFNDLEHITLDLLVNENDVNSPSLVAIDIRENFHEVLVDEYQDTNDVQSTIFSLISKNEDNLFFVGDVKQSIYRFRHAKPSIFIDRLREFQKSQLSNRVPVFLNCNYRCRENIVETVNMIFDYSMTKATSNVDYKETDRLIKGASYENEQEKCYETEFLFATNELKDEPYNIIDLEAEMVIKKIKSLMADKNFLIEDKTLKYSDIVILVRSFNERTLQFLEVFKNNNIPVEYDDKSAFFETIEIKIVLSFLKVLNNPYDDISLLSVLKNFFEISYDEMLELRLENEKQSFYEIIKSVKPEIYKSLEKFRNYSNKHELHLLIDKIYKEFFLMELQSSQLNGESKKQNLKLLADITKNFENTGYKGIASFIAYINSLISSKRDINGSNLTEPVENSIKVMTIHKSKGLEFPVVILPNCDKKLNLRDVSQSVILHDELGIGVDYINIEQRYKYPTFIKKIISQVELKEELQEELRVLYVALTRAREKLIISGAVPNIGTFFEDYISQNLSSKESLSYFDFLSVTNYFDFIMPSVISHPKMCELAKDYVDILPSSFRDFSISCEVYFANQHLDYLNEVQLEMAEAEKNLETIDFEIKENLDKLLEFNYDYFGATVPQKISVSSIINSENISLEENFSNELYSPSFDETKKVSAAMHGSLIHFVFEKISIEDIKKGKPIFSAIEDICNKYSHLKELLSFEDLKKVEEFFNSPLGIKIVRANQVFREKDFLYTAKLSELYKDNKRDDKIVVQGIIDCFFEDNKGNIILIDYKFVNRSEEYIRKKYKPQMELYKLALEKSLGIDGKKIICYIWDVKKSIYIEIF